MRTLRVISVLVLLAAPAVADPDPDPDPVPTFTLQTSMFDQPTPTPQVPSLRLEAARVANEHFADTWRYPEPGDLGGYDGSWYFGNSRYHPRSRRAAALAGGAAGATLLGEILLGTGSPLAGVGALVTGATLDAAAADVDNATEAQQAAPKKKKKKHY